MEAKLYVGNLSYENNERGLRGLFLQTGDERRLTVNAARPQPRGGNECRRY